MKRGTEAVVVAWIAVAGVAAAVLSRPASVPPRPTASSRAIAAAAGIPREIQIPKGTRPALIAAVVAAYEAPGPSAGQMRPGWAWIGSTPEIERIAEFGNEAVPILLANLETEKLRLTALKVFIDRRERSVVPALIEGLRDDDGLLLAALAEITSHPEGGTFYRFGFSRDMRIDAVDAYRNWCAEESLPVPPIPIVVPSESDWQTMRMPLPPQLQRFRDEDWPPFVRAAPRTHAAEFNRLLGEIVAVYAKSPESRKWAQEHYSDLLDRVPDSIGEAVLCDWHHDLRLGSGTADPDPETDPNTSELVRIARQLAAARVPSDSIDPALLRHLRGRLSQHGPVCDRLLTEVAAHLSEARRKQEAIRREALETFEGVPDSVVEAALRDWLHDVKQSLGALDPDPETDRNTELAQRVTRQLEAARIPPSSLGDDVRERLRALHCPYCR